MSGAARGQRIGRRGETRVPSSGGTSRGTQRLSGKTKRALGWALALSSVGVAALFVTRGRGPEHAAADLEDQGPTPRTDFGPAAGSAPPSLLAPAGPDDLASRSRGDGRLAERDLGPECGSGYQVAGGLRRSASDVHGSAQNQRRLGRERTGPGVLDRELGKLRRVDLEPTFQGLLDDKSRFVRKKRPGRSPSSVPGTTAESRPERARGASAPGSARPGRGSAGGCPRCAESDGVG